MLLRQHLDGSAVDSPPRRLVHASAKLLLYRLFADCDYKCFHPRENDEMPGAESAFAGQ
jgi:hypothetical protein